MSSDLKVTNLKHASSGSNNLVLASDGSATIANATISAGTIGGGVTQGAYLNLTSMPSTQEAVITTSIPTTARAIYIMFFGVSTSSSCDVIVQLGTSGGYKTSGYIGTRGYIGSSTTMEASADGFGIKNDISADDSIYSLMDLVSFGSDNIWLAKTIGSYSGTNSYISSSQGAVTLDGALTSLRARVSTGTFDAGKIAVYYK